MYLIAPLASGIVGAAGGTAQLFVRGTGTRASWYAAFEGGAINSSGNDIPLDGNGGAEVYVGQLVDVVVRDAAGATVREFTAGSAAGSIEVISPSFTGADYITALSGTNKPTTLQAVLDAWLTSAGAADFKVLFGGTATLLKNAIAGAQFYNVKDAKYGAVGDGTTDDTAAIQAAMDAARDAGGGWVFFPGNTSNNVYRITAPLTWDAKVSLIGVGASWSTISMDHATARILVGSGTTQAGAPTVVMGLKFQHMQANTGKFIDLTTDAREHVLIDCTFGAGIDSQGIVIDDTGQAASITAFGCRFATRSAMVLVDTFRAFGCRFVAQTWAGGTANLVEIQASGILLMSGCDFYPQGITAGTVKCIKMGANAKANVTGTRFEVFGATTTGTCFEQGAGGEASVTGCNFGLLGSANAATAFVIATGTAFSESGNSWESAAFCLPAMTPYSYTVSTTGHPQFLGSRAQFEHQTTQAGGGTKTLSGELYEGFFVNITDNTAFALNINLAPVGSMVYAVLLATNGAGSGAITWGANIYGTPTTGFTIATTKARLYTFRSMLVNAAHGWVIVGNIGYGGDI